jgi:hypothetical protein
MMVGSEQGVPRLVLGLDVSTSITGYVVLDTDLNLVRMGHIDFSKCNGLWEKTDMAKSVLDALLSEFPVDKVYVEESLMSFSSGRSSAATITTLSKFNALVSYIVRCKVGYDPIHISSATARKTVGIKLLQKKKCGLSHKEQSFIQMTAEHGPLADIVFPRTKTGKFKPFVADEVDAYVIARAGCLLNKPVKSV